MSDTPEILANYGNAAIVTMPGRRFPGCWIAADTMFSWFQCLTGNSTEDFQAEVDDVSEQMQSILASYVRQRRALDEPLPFEWPEFDPPSRRPDRPDEPAGDDGP